MFHKISRQGEQDVASDPFSNAREHCPGDKGSAFEGGDGVTDCSDCPRVYEISGLNHQYSDIYIKRTASGGASVNDPS